MQQVVAGTTPGIAKVLNERAFLGDFNLLISGQLTDESQILFRREIGERVSEIAPFLFYDQDPYLVAADDRVRVGALLAVGHLEAAGDDRVGVTRGRSATIARVG